ncbi:hypothetical protein DPMN_102114 [Dreissena polymorpha]|uniref:Alkaline phosphatase, tissue-nonspecific isozyme n=1 Tax=Dreissena polymorpha TaxID=45954 RepID=A0A9D4R8W2_DREPO|nr:hypothetical protein DPMN_102114 [Dreissena polymorpha]
MIIPCMCLSWFPDLTTGLFEPNHMQYEHERNTSREPSLAMMTQKAIEVLRKGHNGYFLLVEAT